MINVTAIHLRRIRAIHETYRETARLPSKVHWQSVTDDDIWRRFVSQVVVAGKSSPAAYLHCPRVWNRLTWGAISTQRSTTAKRAIWETLREIGARFTGKSVDSCRKSAALLHNLQFLKSQRGPKEYVRKLSTFRTSEEMILDLTKNFKFIKQKGARDFLTSGFGLIDDKIALDVRVLGTLRHIGLHGLPTSTPSSKKLYEAIEAELITKICDPLKISGGHFDQLLYKNADAIQGKSKAIGTQGEVCQRCQLPRTRHCSDV